MDTYTVVSAFSGAGGLDLAVRAAIPTRTICYIEREITCARVLAERASEGLLDEAPIYSDVKTFPTELFAGKVDIDFLLSGFPCQPFSVAGKQEGSEDERNLWPDTLRLIRSLRPRYAFMENVPGLVSHPYFGTILGDLAEAGYDAEWGSFTASEIGASHRRERVFILAHANSSGSGEDLQQAELWSTGTEQSSGDSGSSSEGEDGEVQTGRGAIYPTSELADSISEGLEGVKSGSSNTQGWQEPDGSPGLRSGAIPTWPPGPNESDEWGRILAERPALSPAITKEADREFCLLVDGRSYRVDQLKALGNGVVPAVVAQFLRRLL